MRKLIQNLAALAIGVLVSLSMVGLLEISLRLNKAYRWIDIHAKADGDPASFRVVEKWDGVDRKFLASIPDHFADIRAKYGKRAFEQQSPSRVSPGPAQDGSYNFSKRATNGELVFDVFYRFDGKQRRPTPSQPPHPDKSIYVVGCSYSIGEGVSENETIAAYTQQGLKQTAVETLAFHGWGIGNHLYFLLGKNHETEHPNPYLVMDKEPVIVVYPFIPDHIYRTACPLICYQNEYQWMLGFPNFTVNGKGEVEYLGSFRDSRIFTPALKLIANSAIVTELGLGWIFPGPSTAMKKYFEVLNAYRAELSKRVPVKDFYFVPIEPYFPFGEKVTAMARENGYKVLDLGKLALPEMVGKNPRIPFDGHFTPQVNYILSRLILSRVQKDHPDWR